MQFQFNPQKAAEPRGKQRRKSRDDLVRAGLSQSQANWVLHASRQAGVDLNAYKAAMILALAWRFGPEMTPFIASREEMHAEARAITEIPGFDFAWSLTEGGVQ